MARDQYQTVREVAERLKVSEATVRGWIRGGDLRAIDIGKGWRVADRDLEAFLRSHATRARDAAAHPGGADRDPNPDPGSDRDPGAGAGA